MRNTIKRDLADPRPELVVVLIDHAIKNFGFTCQIFM